MRFEIIVSHKESIPHHESHHDGCQEFFRIGHGGKHEEIPGGRLQGVYYSQEGLAKASSMAIAYNQASTGREAFGHQSEQEGKHHGANKFALFR